MRLPFYKKTRIFDRRTWETLMTYKDKAPAYFKYLFLLVLVMQGGLIFSQTIPVSDQLMQDYLRIRQLEGKLDSNISLTVRHVAADLLNGLDSSSTLVYLPKQLTSSSSLFKFKLLPISTIQQVNSHHPYVWNDGLMIPAKGYQQYLSGGFFASLGPLSVQLKPEYIYASNPEYLEGDDVAASERYIDFISRSFYGADLPAYHEKPNYSFLGLGQSSLRLTVGPVSLGISNENLWWGPGRRNSLLMSNSSRGFNHVTLNTTRPVVTKVGSFEGQIISAHLDNSNSALNATKNQDWRYLSGMVLNYQPKWVPGLFVGLTRVFQMYNSDVRGIGDYFPLLQPFEKLKTNEDDRNRDQVTSVFARLLLPESQSEIYFEYGRNDHSVDIRDFIMEPEHSRAYIVGAQKLVSLNRDQEKLLIAAEVTQLSQSATRFVRDAGTWYVHSISQGYTHTGEVIGASAGPGGNMQTFEFSLLNGLRKYGLLVERYVHNDDYYRTISVGSRNFNGQWVDLSAGFLYNRSCKNLLIQSKFIAVKSFNYLWQSGANRVPQQNIFNVHGQLGVSYYFK